MKKRNNDVLEQKGLDVKPTKFVVNIKKAQRITEP